MHGGRRSIWLAHLSKVTGMDEDVTGRDTFKLLWQLWVSAMQTTSMERMNAQVGPSQSWIAPRNTCTFFAVSMTQWFGISAWPSNPALSTTVVGSINGQTHWLHAGS